MQPRDVIVVGASAGGVEALAHLVRGLSADLAAAVFVVLHLPVDARSFLPDILNRAGPLPCSHATDGEVMERGRIYVAPPNHHLILEGTRMHLSFGPRINNVRPSIDVLFRSAARGFDGRTIGVVLSGTLDDGTLGLDAIRLRGGTVVIQDPAEAQFSGMPRNALERVTADYVLPVNEIASLLMKLTARPGHPAHPAIHPQGNDAVNPDQIPIAPSAEVDPAPHEKRGNAASGFTCPNCHGSVWEIDDGGLPRIECRVGHAFSVDAFLGEQGAAMEDAIWSAINALEERGMTLRRFAQRFAHIARRRVAYTEEAEIVEHQAGLLRDGLARVVQSETNGPLGSS
ncbi:MAG: chemotaxis protein CheB [Chloroflexota bacterium]